MKTTEGSPGPVAQLEAYFTRYMAFADPTHAFIAALWTIGTYCWPHFDAFPYLTITSATKRSGKTRFSELLGFACSNPRSFTAATAATLFRLIRDQKPTIIVDEAEDRSSDAVDTMRQIINAGYRRGQTVPRMNQGEVEEWPVYCPKVFILIGDPTDTLRDRCIIFWMRRAVAPARFIYSLAQAEGQALRESVADQVAVELPKMLDWYGSPHARLDFLDGREEEIWLPLFAVARAFAPNRIAELRRAAVDLSADKTRTAASFRELKSAEKDAEADEYARRLLLDVSDVLKGHRSMFSADVVKHLHGLDVAPWRKFQGHGLTVNNLADLLARFPGARPKLVKIRGKVQRGYQAADITRAVRSLGSVTVLP